MGADPESVTMGEKLSTMYALWKESMKPGSPIIAELSKDPQMKTLINSYRIGTISIGALIFIALVIMKRKKKKKALMIPVPIASTKS